MRFINELRQTCEKLKDFPNSGANPKDRILLSLGYKYSIHKNYLIFYSVNQEEKKIYNNAFFNGKTDYVKVLKNRIKIHVIVIEFPGEKNGGKPVKSQKNKGILRNRFRVRIPRVVSD